MTKRSSNAGPEFIRAFIAQGYLGKDSSLRTEIEAKAKALIGGSEVALRAGRIAAVWWQAAEIAQKAGLIAQDIDIRKIAWAFWEKSQESQIAMNPVELAIRTLFGNLILGKGSTVTEPGSEHFGKTEARWLPWFDIGPDDEGQSRHEDVFVVPTDKIVKMSGGAISQTRIG